LSNTDQKEEEVSLDREGEKREKKKKRIARPKN